MLEVPTLWRKDLETVVVVLKTLDERGKEEDGDEPRRVPKRFLAAAGKLPENEFDMGS